MKLRTPSLVLAFFCLPVLACADSKNSFFSDGGAEGGKVGDGGGDGGKTGVDCATACATFAERSDTCSDTDKCETSCKAAKKAATTAECLSEWEAVFACAAAAGQGTGGKPPTPAPTCDSKGAIKISSGCTSKKTALDECLAPTTEEDSGPPPGSCTLTKPVDSSNPSCNSCAEQNCCDSWNTCNDSTSCNDFVDCAAACPTSGSGATTCIQACQSSYAVGASEYQAALQCTQGACATPCEL